MLMGKRSVHSCWKKVTEYISNKFEKIFEFICKYIQSVISWENVVKVTSKFVFKWVSFSGN